MNKTIWIIITLAILAVLGYWLTIEPTSVFQDWKTYRNEEFGFEFKYPPTSNSKHPAIENVEILEIEKGTEEFNVYKNGTYYPVVMVSSRQVDPSTDMGNLGGVPTYIHNGYYYYLNTSEPELSSILSTFKFTE